MNFEEGGSEIKGLCHYEKPSASYGRCPGKNEGDANTPDVNWKFPRVDVTLLPGAGGGELVFAASAMRVLGDFHMNGPCGSHGECKKLIGDWEGRLKSTMETQVRSMLNQASVRKAEARVTRPLLDEAGITAPLWTAGLDGSTLVVTYLERHGLAAAERSAAGSAERARRQHVTIRLPFCRFAAREPRAVQPARPLRGQRRLRFAVVGNDPVDDLRVVGAGREDRRALDHLAA